MGGKCAEKWRIARSSRKEGHSDLDSAPAIYPKRTVSRNIPYISFPILFSPSNPSFAFCPTAQPGGFRETPP